MPRRPLLPRLVLLALLASMASMAYAQSRDTTTSAEAEALFVRALTETFLGDHEQAVTLFDRVLALQPNEPTVLAALAESHRALGHPAEALYYATEAIEYAPDEPSYYTTLAALQADADQPEAAIDTYERLLVVTPRHTEALRALGRLQERTGRYAEAIETYRRLLDLEGDDAALMLRIEALYARLGDPSSALRMLEEAARAFPDERVLLIRLGLAYREAGRLREAADAFERLVALDPADTEATQFLISIAEAMGDAERADSLREDLNTTDSPEDRLRQAALLYARIEDDPNAADEALQLLEPFAEDADAPAEALFILGDLLYLDRDYERAAPILMRALNEDPRKPDVWEQAAASFLYTGRPDEALATAEEGLLLFPGQVGLLRLQAYALAKTDRPREALRSIDDALRILAEDAPLAEGDSDGAADRARLLSFKGVLHHELDEADQAFAAFDEALALAPDHALVLNNYAYTLAEREARLDAALAMAQRAVEAHPNNAWFLDTLGWVLFKLGRLDKATDFLERAVAADENSALLYDHLGDVYAAQGRTTEARTAWRRALDLDPENDDLREKLAGR